MSRKKSASVETSPDTKMQNEMRNLDLTNAMMKKALAEQKKNLEEMRKLKAEQALLVGEDNDNQGFDDSPSRSRRPYDRSPEGQIERSAEFENTLSEFTDTEGKVEVYRLKDNNYAKVGTFPAKEWGNSLENVAVKFGGGTYKVRLRCPDGTLGGETICTFDEEAYPKPSLRPVDNTGANQMQLFEMMAQREEKNQDKFMLMMSTMMSTLANTIGQKTNMIANMSDLAQFKQLFGDKDKAKDGGAESVEKFLNMFQMGMEFGQKNAGGDGEPSFMNLIMKALSGDGLPKLTEALKASLPPPPPPAAAPRAGAPRPAVRNIPKSLPLPVQQGEAIVPEPANNPEPEAPQMSMVTKMFLSTYRPIILGYAKGNAEPSKVAELIVERVGALNEGWLLIVDDFLKVPTTKEMFVYANAPELREYEAWVDLVMVELSLAIAEYFAEPAPKAAKPKKEKKAPAPQAGDTPIA